MKKTFFTIASIFVILMVIAHQCDKGIRENRVETPKEKITCIVCGKDLTDNYNRMCPNGKEYFCMPCYHQMMERVNKDIQSEDHSASDNSASSSTYDSSNTESLPQNESGYTTGSDGKIYEKAPCSLCNGTGIETSTARNPATGEYDSRVCPQCNGTGHQSY